MFFVADLGATYDERLGIPETFAVMWVIRNIEVFLDDHKRLSFVR